MIEKPKILVTYEGQDITEDITSDLLSLTYSDRTQGESDEISISLQDSTRKWQSDWYPSKGDKINLKIGYSNTDLVDCGDFEVDEIEISGPPDKCTIRALAAGINSPIRTKKSQAHETQTIRQIAEKIADQYGWEIVDGTLITYTVNEEATIFRNAAAAARDVIATGTSEAEFLRVANQQYLLVVPAARSIMGKGHEKEGAEIIENAELWRRAYLSNALPSLPVVRDTVLRAADRLEQIANGLSDLDRVISKTKLSLEIERETQSNESDLSFLSRVSVRYGIVFSVRGSKMIFTSIFDLEGAGAAVTLDRSQITSYRMKDKAVKTYRAARLKYHDSQKRTTHIVEVEEDAADGIDTGDVLVVNERVENEKQAEEIARAALYANNSKTAEASLEVKGSPTLVAGINIILTGLGQMNGKWHIKESTHRITRSGGYSTSLNLKRHPGNKS